MVQASFRPWLKRLADKLLPGGRLSSKAKGRHTRPVRSHKPALEALEDRALPSITLSGVPTWVDQGPGPINKGQITADPNNAVTGAVQSLVEHPTTAGMVFAGTVAGGVWRTADITGGGNPANVNWVPLSDTLESLYVGALATDPSNPNTLYVGTGSYSNTFRNQLSESALGLYRTTDDTAANVHWEDLGRTTFAGLAISSIVVSRADSNLLLVAAANPDGSGGLFRSETGGQTWTTLSDDTVLPFTSSVTDVIADPTSASRFYAAAPGQGVFETDTNGDSWTRIDNLNNAITGIDVSTNLRLAVHQQGAQTILFVGVIDDNGGLSGVFRTTVNGPATTWSEIGTAPAINNGGQGFPNFSLAADPGDANLVYVGGDQPPDIFRGDASANQGAGDWFQISGSANVSDTGPHADSRSLIFLRSGNLLESDDGGVYSLTHPQDPMNGTDAWTTLAGNLRNTEFHGVAYDTAANLVFGGAQDNGAEVQSATGSLTWNHFRDGDGSTQAYSVPGDVRYSLGNNFGNFGRTSGGVSTDLTLADPATPEDSFSGLENTSGPGNDQDFAGSGNFESHLAVEANRFNANGLLFGRRALYESNDQGDTINIVIAPTDFNKSATERFQSAAYGGVHNGTNFANVFYAGTEQGSLYVRDETGTIKDVTAALNAVIPGTDTISDITLDPADYTRAFVVKGNRVALTTDAGQHWQEITDNLGSLTSEVRSIALVDPTPTVPGGGVVVVGGLGGVFRLLNGLAGTCDAGQPTWTQFGDGLPHSLVQDLDYVATDPDGNAANGTGVLLAGTFGRGAWTIANVTATIQINGVLTVTGDNTNNALALRQDPSNANRIIVSDGLGNTQGFDKAEFERVDFQGLGGNDTITVSSDGTSGATATGDVKFVTFLLQVAGGGQPGDRLILEDRGDQAAAQVTVTSTTIGEGTGDTFLGDCGRVGYTGLGNLTLDLSNNAATGDTANVQSTASGTTTVLQGNGGNDTFNVSSDAPANTGDLAGFAGLLTLDGGAGTNTLNVSEAGRAAGDTLTLTSSQISSTVVPFTIDYLATGGTFGGGITLTTGSGNDTVNVQSAFPGTLTTIATGAGNDRVNVNVTSQSAYTLRVDGGPDVDLLAVTDVEGGAVIHDHKSGPASGTVQVCYLVGATSVITYQSVETVTTNPSADQSFVQDLYHQFLKRNGSPAEINGWVVALQGPGGRTLVANGIIRSQEARTLLVQSWYVQYLKRPASGGEEQGWVNLLLAGFTEETVLASFLNSPEYYQRAGLQDGPFLQNLYQDGLGRPAGGNEVALWLGSLQSTSGRSGTAWLVFNSIEYRSKLVQADYQNLLMRAGSAAELAGWVLSGLDATTLAVLFASSQEFFDNGC